MIQAYAAMKAGDRLTRIEFDPGPLRPGQVEIDVLACGLCHSDLSMVNNEWGDSRYPLVPGNEIVGTIGQVGAGVRHLKAGDRVGLGWFSGSCMVCPQCMSGNHNFCGDAEQTLVGRHGGFADKVRCQAEWALPLPEGMDAVGAGPLFCAGITVFNALVQFDVKPTQRVGVVGIGGLGHLALQFLARWGCEVTAFTSSRDKHKECLRLGAHRVVDSLDTVRIRELAGSLDFIISTADADLDWVGYVETLAPRGRLDLVGIVPAPVALPATVLIGGGRSLSGSMTGSPAALRTMLEFCARHRIAPVIETFPMSRANEALARLAGGEARYRIVLENDFPR